MVNFRQGTFRQATMSVLNFFREIYSTYISSRNFTMVMQNNCYSFRNKVNAVHKYNSGLAVCNFHRRQDENSLLYLEINSPSHHFVVL